MDGFILRIIAMVTMLTDHIGWNFLDNSMILTWIGRVAFPIYAYLLAEGFLATCKNKDRIIKHLSLLLILTIVSELGYDILESRLDVQNYLESQSNMFTLLLGYIGMLATHFIIPNGKKVGKMNIFAIACTYILIGFSNYMLNSNFNIVGPLLVVAFYWYIRMMKNSSQSYSWIKRFSFLILIFVCYLPIYFWVRSDFGNLSRWYKEVTLYLPWVAGHGLAALILSFSNGKLGYHEKWFKYVYISFYPIHTFVIGMICVLIGR